MENQTSLLFTHSSIFTIYLYKLVELLTFLKFLDSILLTQCFLMLCSILWVEMMCLNQCLIALLTVVKVLMENCAILVLKRNDFFHACITQFIRFVEWKSMIAMIIFIYCTGMLSIFIIIIDSFGVWSFLNLLPGILEFEFLEMGSMLSVMIDRTIIFHIIFTIII